MDSLSSNTPIHDEVQRIFFPDLRRELDISLLKMMEIGELLRENTISTPSV